MNALSPEQTKQYEAIVRIKEELADALLARREVRAVGVGFKEVAGEETAQLAIRIYVTQKRTDVAPDQVIPATLQGVPTDVIQFNPRPAEHAAPAVGVDDKKYNPLIGGISIGPSRMPNDLITRGTLGLMVVDDATQNPLMLSNFHVMCLEDGKQKIGDLICQPSRADQVLQYCSDCSQLYRWAAVDDVKGDGGTSLGGVDCAVAARTHRDCDVGKIAEVGEVSGAAAARLGMPVLKRGCATLLRYGTVSDISCDTKEDFGGSTGTLTLRKQIVIDGKLGVVFSDQGDSGSVIVSTDDKTVVGLLWGADGHRSVASPIAAVKRALSVSIR